MSLEDEIWLLLYIENILSERYRVICPNGASPNPVQNWDQEVVIALICISFEDAPGC